MALPILDTFGRKHTYLRISLTDKCNLRCTYCMPQEDMQFMPSKWLMQADEISYLAGLFVEMGVEKIRLTGGTGLSPRDVTPEAVSELIDREIPGIAETARQYGQERVPTSMLSRSAAGFMGEMLVITMPGSTGGVTEYIDALFPHVLHIFNVLEGKKHE